MNITMRNFLSGIGWRVKIMGLSMVFLVGMAIIGLTAGVSIYRLNSSLQATVDTSMARINVANNARATVLQMSTARANLLAANDAQAVRTAAIAAVRASSTLDESLQELGRTLDGSADVATLVQLYDRLRPTQMKLIAAVKSEARDRVDGLMSDINDIATRFDDLSAKIMDDEQAALKKSMTAEAQRSHQLVSVLGVAIVVAIVIGLIISVLAAGWLTRPLQAMQRAIQRMADGDLTVAIEPLGGDEIGQAAAALATTVKRLNQMVSDILGKADSLHDQAGNIDVASDHLHDIYEEMTAMVTAIKGETDVVIDSVTSSFQHVEEASKTAEETTTSTLSTADKIMEVVSDFEVFQREMESTQEVTRKLEASARAITEITQTIREISNQTNLLALNAAIEAARAGEAGRGFAVVADEVRQLATHANSATDSITQQVESIASDVEITVTSLGRTTETACRNIADLRQIADKTATNSQQVQQMKQAMTSMVAHMEAQQQAVGSIQSSITTLTSVTRTTSDQIEHLRGLSVHLNDASSSVRESFRHFHV
jgi:methyl-accepting chemotaxis protein